MGNLYTLVAGWVLPYSILPLVCSVPALLFCAGVFLVPESAVYLIQSDKGEYDSVVYSFLHHCMHVKTLPTS